MDIGIISEKCTSTVFTYSLISGNTNFYKSPHTRASNVFFFFVAKTAIDLSNSPHYLIATYFPISSSSKLLLRFHTTNTVSLSVAALRSCNLEVEWPKLMSQKHKAQIIALNIKLLITLQEHLDQNRLSQMLVILVNLYRVGIRRNNYSLKSFA